MNGHFYNPSATDNLSFVISHSVKLPIAIDVKLPFIQYESSQTILSVLSRLYRNGTLPNFVDGQ